MEQQQQKENNVLINKPNKSPDNNNNNNEKNQYKPKQLKKKRLIWQAQVLLQLESIRALLFILTLVTFISLYFIVHIIANLKEDPIFYDIDFSISMVFISEVLLRMYCYGAVNKNMSAFFQSWYHVIDFSVMLFDVFLICLNSQLNTTKNFTHSGP